MKPEIKTKFMKALENKKIKTIIESKDFYFNKAFEIYNEFISLPKLDSEKTNKIVNRVKELINSKSFNHMNLLEEYKNDLSSYNVLYKIGELVSYIDLSASNKNNFNKYDDKRTLALSGVRQQVWVTHLLNYKESENLEELPDTIKNAIKYIIYPENFLNILSERHRKLIGIFLFQNQNTSLNFDEFVMKEMSELDIQVNNEKNLSLVYEKLIYSVEIKKLWNHTPNIWKISHGYIQFFKHGKREKYLKDEIVAVHKDTGLGQGKNFIDTMKKGDLFYLCYGGKEIKLLGIITSEAKELKDVEEDGWMYRNYKLIKENTNKDKYTGANQGWSPNHNSTCMSVKENQLTVFEKYLLLPYFDMTLEKLLSGTNIIDSTIINESVDEPDNNKFKLFDDLNYIIYGPPGTGKTYNTINYAVAMIENKEVETLIAEDFRTVKERYEKLKDNKQISFTTFHQSFAYEEFLEGIKPKLNQSNSSAISYCISEGLFKKFCSEAEKHINKNYVFIIDEINRGNISNIFGELITLIEKSKRIGMPEETNTILPYSKDEFGVPKNVFILGTMNTADRFIALLDTALRRRFKFIEMMPDTSIFKKLNSNNELIVEGINIKNMLKMINKRIEILYDRDHTIGQAYFIDLIKNNTIDKLNDIFQNKIIPLLQEYFYDDYEKIRIILGDNQVNNTELQFINTKNITKDILGENFDYEIFEDKKIYMINNNALTNPLAYIKIYDINSIGVYEDNG
jgi:hypothetical protein